MAILAGGIRQGMAKPAVDQNMRALQQIEVAVVVDVPQREIRPRFVLGTVVIETAEVWDEVRAADVLELAPFKLAILGLKHEKGGLR